MSNHVRRFEKFESWANRLAIQFYPITDDKSLKYAMAFDCHERGPTVLPSTHLALRWVAFRTNITVPSFETAEIKALEKEIFVQRGKPPKEAESFSVELVAAMETFVVNDVHPKPARVFIWWVLCVIFASLSFDDAIHVKPQELEVKGGIELFEIEFPLVERDFWIPDLETKTQ